MRGRAYVLVFFFWALLTVITPTLVIWSESLKPSLHSDGDKSSEETNPRRMMGYIEKHPRRMVVAPEMEINEAPSPAPKADEKPVPGTGNQTSTSLLQLRSNCTGDQAVVNH